MNRKQQAKILDEVAKWGKDRKKSNDQKTEQTHREALNESMYQDFMKQEIEDMKAQDKLLIRFEDASGAQDIAEIKACLEEGKRFNLGVNTPFGRNGSKMFLSDAVLHDNLDIVEELISLRADVNQKNPDKRTALHSAHSVESLKILLENNAEINAQDKNGNTPLMQLARSNLLEPIKFLLEQKADPTITNKEGATAKNQPSISEKRDVRILNLLEKAETLAEAKAAKARPVGGGFRRAP